MGLYCFSKRFRNFAQNIPYFHYLKLIGTIAILSTTFAMIYQLYFELEVCILCWWQRIFIFPIDIIIIVSLWKKIRGNHIITGTLAGIGLFFALYHYYYHFMGHVMGFAVSMPCEVG
jgi:disulfide bond formation protein DsbB